MLGEENGKEEMKKTICKLREDQLGRKVLATTIFTIKISFAKSRWLFGRYIFIRNAFFDMVDAVLRYAVKWNMNSKHCHAAQYILSTVLHSYTPDELNQLTSVRSTIQGLLPYTGTFTIILNSLIYG